jgi:hypothetical protein
MKYLILVLFGPLFLACFSISPFWIYTLKVFSDISNLLGGI